MLLAQPGILQPPARVARASSFECLPGCSPQAVYDALSQPLGDEIVGLGLELVQRLVGVNPIAELRQLPALCGVGVSAPSTPRALWVQVRGEDRGQLVHRSRAWAQRVQGCLRLVDSVDTFTYREGRDLTGYVDGTENPSGEEAEHTALVGGSRPGLDGGSFVAVQRWQHDLSGFAALSAEARDHVMGRRLTDNEEIEDAPETAHVKRAAQEDYTPPAFMLRRSMPYSDASGDGLLFIAFGRTFDPFEAVLRRMLGLDDGRVDGLFSFSRPRDGAYYWCPPLDGGTLDLRVLRDAARAPA